MYFSYELPRSRYTFITDILKNRKYHIARMLAIIATITGTRFFFFEPRYQRVLFYSKTRLTGQGAKKIQWGEGANIFCILYIYTSYFSVHSTLPIRTNEFIHINTDQREKGGDSLTGPTFPPETASFYGQKLSRLVDDFDDLYLFWNEASVQIHFFLTPPILYIRP